jgi:hypothetical protein
MGNPVPKDVQDAFYRVVHDFGVERLASMMGMSPGVLYNKANCNDGSHHKPTLADCIVITNLTLDKRIAQAFAHSAGGVFCELPDLSSLSTDALMLHVLRIDAEGGDVHRVIHESLELDNKISGKEFRIIEREAQQWIAAILEGLARMREMACR